MAVPPRRARSWLLADPAPAARRPAPGPVPLETEPALAPLYHPTTQAGGPALGQVPVLSRPPLSPWRPPRPGRPRSGSPTRRSSWRPARPPFERHSAPRARARRSPGSPRPAPRRVGPGRTPSSATPRRLWHRPVRARDRLLAQAPTVQERAADGQHLAAPRPLPPRVGVAQGEGESARRLPVLHGRHGHLEHVRIIRFGGSRGAPAVNAVISVPLRPSSAGVRIGSRRPRALPGPPRRSPRPVARRRRGP